MINLGENCKKCLCARCGNRRECGTWGGNTLWYCHKRCNGYSACMVDCSQYEPLKDGNENRPIDASEIADCTGIDSVSFAKFFGNVIKSGFDDGLKKLRGTDVNTLGGNKI